MYIKRMFSKGFLIKIYILSDIWTTIRSTYSVYDWNSIIRLIYVLEVYIAKIDLRYYEIRVEICY